MLISNSKKTEMTEYLSDILREADTKEEMLENLADIILSTRDACFHMTTVEERVDNLDFFDGVKLCYKREVDSLINRIKSTQKED